MRYPGKWIGSLLVGIALGSLSTLALAVPMVYGITASVAIAPEVPEPGALALLGLGVLSIAAAGARRRTRASRDKPSPRR